MQKVLDKPSPCHYYIIQVEVGELFQGKPVERPGRKAKGAVAGKPVYASQLPVQFLFGNGQTPALETRSGHFSFTSSFKASCNIWHRKTA